MSKIKSAKGQQRDSPSKPVTPKHNIQYYLLFGLHLAQKLDKVLVCRSCGQHGVSSNKFFPNNAKFTVTNNVCDIVARLKRILNCHTLVELPRILTCFTFLRNKVSIPNTNDMAAPVKVKSHRPKEANHEFSKRVCICLRKCRQFFHGLCHALLRGKIAALRVCVKVGVLLSTFIVALHKYDREILRRIIGLLRADTITSPGWRKCLQRWKHRLIQVLQVVDNQQDISVAGESALGWVVDFAFLCPCLNYICKLPHARINKRICAK
mmetsp:Transcript_7621/g.15111  ORF Transcript_7621/g.15111 Transcript_7621/m.15111 type:complete len:266 (+) Transcript_7621:91-888(+)